MCIKCARKKLNITRMSIKTVQKMTPEEEIDRIKEEYKEHWHWLKDHRGIMAALSKSDPVMLGEIAAMVVHGGGGYRYLENSRHQVLVFVKNCDKPMGFDSLESARVFIRTSDKNKIHLVMVRDENRNWGTVSF